LRFNDVSDRHAWETFQTLEVLLGGSHAVEMQTAMHKVGVRYVDCAPVMEKMVHDWTMKIKDHIPLCCLVQSL
jgi:hypothetical protein